VSNLNPENLPKVRERYLSPLEWETKYCELNAKQIVELLNFFYDTGYISREFHDPVHELKFNLEVILDKLVPGWSPEDLKKLVKEARGEN
jgi:hypothetical protein